MTIEALLERIAVALENRADVNVPAVTASPVSSVIEDKPKRGRPAKVVAPRGEPVEAMVDVEEDGFLDADEPVKEVTIEDVRTALIAYQKWSSPRQAIKLLKDVGGAETLRSLPVARYAAVHAAALAAATA